MGIDNVADVSRRVQYTASAAQTAFPYTFPIFDEDDLVVQVDGVTQTITTDYTVSDVEEDDGGNVTFVEAMTGGEIITIYSDTAIQRLSDFAQNGPKFSTVMNDELDRITVVQQELREAVGRAIRFPMSVPLANADIELSPISAWEDRYLFINSDGELEPAANLTTTTLTQSVIGGLLYPQTEAEEDALVTPTNYAYSEGNLFRYGGVADGTTSNNTALANLLAVMEEGVAGYIPVGTFAYSTSPNFAVSGLTLKGERGSILKHTGTGVAFNIDAGGSGSRVDGLNVENLIVQGNANTTDIFYMRGAVRSRFTYLEARSGCTGKAFNIRFSVANLFVSCFISDNVSSITTEPAHGFYLDNDGTPGYYSADNTFVNCIAEGFAGNGATLVDASGNRWVGGTMEDVDVGVSITSDDCMRNVFDSLWCEANADSDVLVKGNNNAFHDCYLLSSAAADPNVDISTGQGTVFSGGVVRTVDLQGTSRDTLFEGVAFSDNVSLGITGSGTYKSIGCVEVDSNLDITATLNDVLGARSSFTGSLTGCTTTPTGSIEYSVNGDLVTLEIPAITGTSNTTAATITGVPAAIRPAALQRRTITTVDNGVTGVSIIQVNTDGTITLFNGATPVNAVFTGSGTKGIDAGTVTYRIS